MAFDFWRRWRETSKPSSIIPEPEPKSAKPPSLLTVRQLWAAMPHASVANVRKYQPHLEAAAREHGIDTPLRLAHWLAQIAHESGSLRYVEEIADGSAYEGRRDLGNTQPGDGKRFKGRGLIQLTGRDNYRRYARELVAIGDIMENPGMLTEPKWSADVAGWFWRVNHCNRWADLDDLRAVSGIVNAGNPRATRINGLADRMARLIEAKKGLGLL